MNLTQVYQFWSVLSDAYNGWKNTMRSIFGKVTALALSLVVSSVPSQAATLIGNFSGKVTEITATETALIPSNVSLGDTVHVEWTYDSELPVVPVGNAPNAFRFPPGTTSIEVRIGSQTWITEDNQTQIQENASFGDQYNFSGFSTGNNFPGGLGSDGTLLIFDDRTAPFSLLDSAAVPNSPNDIDFDQVTETRHRIRSVDLGNGDFWRIGFDTDPDTLEFGEVVTSGYEFSDVIENTRTGGLDKTPSGPTLLASFRPNFDLTLDEATQIGGYDHFNWYQTVVEFPGFLIGANGLPVVAPFVDPPPGGFGGLGIFAGEPADNLPFYLDEVDVGSDFFIDDNISNGGRVLNFDDTPNSNFIPLLGDKMSFVTSLVGVFDDGEFETLKTFTWSSDNNFASTPQVSRFRFTDDEIANFQANGMVNRGIFDVILVDPVSLPTEIQDTMIRDGWRGQRPGVEPLVAPVPIPASILIYLTSLLAVFVFGARSSTRHELCA